MKHEFDGDVRVRADNETGHRDFSGTRVEAGVGVSAQLNDRFSLYAEGTYEKGSRIEGAGVNLGVRFIF